LLVSTEQRKRLTGQACARCGSGDGLRPGGHAYTRTSGGGRLGWAVMVCAGCPERPEADAGAGTDAGAAR
jgi:hypothetical protein